MGRVGGGKKTVSPSGVAWHHGGKVVKPLRTPAYWPNGQNLNNRRQRLDRDNRAEVAQNHLLKQSANLNPLMLSKSARTRFLLGTASILGIVGLGAVRFRGERLTPH